MFHDWAFKEINKLIRVSPKDLEVQSDCLHLVNPESEKMLDDIFYKYFLPKIEDVYINSPFDIYGGQDYPEFKVILSRSLRKSFTFITEDYERPILPGELHRIWFVRFKLELGTFDYMLTTELFLNFPVDFETGKIFQLLKNPNFAGNPPELTCEEYCHSVRLREGKGAGWGYEPYEQAAKRIAKKVEQIHKILKFINRHEKKLHMDKNFLKLEELLAGYFENY